MSPHPFLAGIVAAGASTASVMVAVGLIVAIANASPAAVDTATLLIFLIVFVVALIHALVLGLPIYTLLSPRRRASLPVNLGVSFLIGAIPIPLLLALMTLSSGLVSASSGGVQTFVDGRPTIHFLLETLEMAAVFGAIGMAGGVTFWLLLRERQSVL